MDDFSEKYAKHKIAPLVGERTESSVLEAWLALEIELQFLTLGSTLCTLSIVCSVCMQIVFLKLFINDEMTLKE